ncbi:MAG: hypothetical protein WAL35_05320 [Acidimicrobiales bacterium]
MTGSEKSAEMNASGDSPATPIEPEVQPDTSTPSPFAHTRTSGYWASVVVGLLVLLVLLVFILENGQTARVAFFGVHGHLPQGVALLFAAVVGGLFVVLVGAARILQLRVRTQGHFLTHRLGRRRRKAAPRHESQAPEDSVAQRQPPD